MNTAKVIEGINATIEGLNLIKNALASDNEEVASTPTTTVTGKFSREQLEKMKFNDFKKLAASLGVKCTGTREEIIERILALDVEVDVDEAPVKEEVSVVKEEPVEEAVAEESEESEESEVDYVAMAKQIVEESGVENCIEALKECNVKATKKNVVEKLAEAIEQGLVEIDDEAGEEYESDSTAEEDFSEDEDEEEVDEDSDDEEDSEEDEDEDDSSEEDDEEEVDASSYFAKYDPHGINDPDNMTDERKEAIEKMMEEILDSVDDDDFIPNVEKYLEENATDAEIDLLGEDYDETEEAKLYMEMKKRTIDDDGEEHEPAKAESEEGDPYEINGHDMCCGHELKYIKKTKKYVCEHCGAEFEAE
ncbi:MAG: hypothetical protein IJ883_00325 [Eubacterium sp.]|nr:hypothetical protein [Eubacterium sp.]